LAAKILKKIGIAPVVILGELREGFTYVLTKSIHLLYGLQDLGGGFIGVSATFLPRPSLTSLTPWAPKVVRAIWSKSLRYDFIRGARRDLTLA
jgi:hypothetical protein